MPVSVQVPFPWFPDADGADLDGGYIYIGQPNTDPVVQANRVAIFSDPAMTVAIPNPFRTVAGFPVDGNGDFQNVYVATDFSFTALGSNNLTRLYTCASYAMRFLSDTITFGTGIFSVGVRGAVAGVSFNGTNAIPWESVVSREVRAKNATVYNATQPSLAAHLARQTQLTMMLLMANQTSLAAAPAVTFANGFNCAAITHTGVGIYHVAPIVPLPALYFATATANDAGTLGYEFAIINRTALGFDVDTTVAGVLTECAFDVFVWGNPAVADPIS